MTTPQSKAKYTPGPWRVDAKQRGIVRINNDPLCGILVGQEANTKLVASAPELAEACQMALSCLSPDDDDALARALKSALRKAGVI